jgi:hypothetical protein
VTNRRKGRALLERLLGSVEDVVRVSPADVLVVTGVQDDDTEMMERLPELLEQFGVEARGVILLGVGMDVNSIDLEELVALDRMADEVEEGQTVVGHTSIDGLTVPVRCPRCEQPIDMSVTASVQDTGTRLIGGASVDGRDLELHAMVCPGKS